MIFVRSKTESLIKSLVFDTTQKMKFPIEDLVTFTKEVLNGKLYLVCIVTYSKLYLTNQKDGFME